MEDYDNLLKNLLVPEPEITKHAATLFKNQQINDENLPLILLDITLNLNYFNVALSLLLKLQKSIEFY